MKSRTLEDQLYLAGAVLLAAGALGIWLFYYVILPRGNIRPCIFDTVLGMYCPGCGGTRAVWALLHGHVLQSLWYHPLVPYTAVIYGGFMLTQTLERLTGGRIRGWKFHDWYLYAMLGIILFHVVEKNLLRLVFHIAM